jgi:hypothetical protein
VDRLALVEKIENFDPEYRIGEEVAEIKGAQKFPERVAGFEDGIAGGG